MLALAETLRTTNTESLCLPLCFKDSTTGNSNTPCQSTRRETLRTTNTESVVVITLWLYLLLSLYTIPVTLVLSVRVQGYSACLHQQRHSVLSNMQSKCLPHSSVVVFMEDSVDHQCRACVFPQTSGIPILMVVLLYVYTQVHTPCSVWDTIPARHLQHACYRWCVGVAVMPSMLLTMFGLSTDPQTATPSGGEHLWSIRRHDVSMNASGVPRST